MVSRHASPTPTMPNMLHGSLPYRNGKVEGRVTLRHSPFPPTMPSDFPWRVLRE